MMPDKISRRMLLALGLTLPTSGLKTKIFEQNASPFTDGSTMKVISTWPFGIPANARAWELLQNGSTALDAVEQGVKVTEADPEVTSVGYNGSLDRDGRLTLDACIMDHRGMCGSVAGLEHIMHPISVARAIMEKTPHVMLVGSGALDFAISQGFPKENIVTDDAIERWRNWQKSQKAPPLSPENHDTIGMLAIDSSGN